MTYTAHISKDGAFYAKDGKPCTREEFEAALQSMTKAPAAGPVCEWRPISKLDSITHYSTTHGVTNDLNLWRRNNACAFCGKPIKFTEAAR